MLKDLECPILVVSVVGGAFLKIGIRLSIGPDQAHGDLNLGGDDSDSASGPDSRSVWQMGEGNFRRTSDGAEVIA